MPCYLISESFVIFNCFRPERVNSFLVNNLVLVQSSIRSSLSLKAYRRILFGKGSQTVSGVWEDIAILCC